MAGSTPNQNCRRHSRKKNYPTIWQKPPQKNGRRIARKHFNTHTLITEINPASKILTDKNKKTYPYEKLVLACGADTLQPEVSGDAANEIHAVNQLHHYSQFREWIAGKKNITLLGAGLIGCEFANDLVNGGFEVNVISPAHTPLDLLLPEKIGQILQQALTKNGVQFHFDCVAKSIDKINPDDNNASPRYRLVLSNGKQIETDFVLSAIGLRPHVALAKKAGLSIERGIAVNRYLETSQPDIYSLGDCAEVEGYVLPILHPSGMQPLRWQPRWLAIERQPIILRCRFP